MIIRPNSDYELGLLGRLFSLCLFFLAIAVTFLGIALLVYLLNLFPSTTGGYIRIPGYVVVPVLLPFVIPSWKLWRLGRRLRSLTPAGLLRKDKRAPILYLRNFQSDNEEDLRSMGPTIGSVWMQRTVEERDVQHLSRIGPVLAVSRPGTRLPPIGAARIAFSDADWKTGVRELVNDSQLVVVKIGISSNLFWELGELFRARPFKPVLVCMPPSQDPIMNTQRQYEKFRRFLAEELPTLAGALPRELGDTGYFLFHRPDRFTEFSGLLSTFPLELLEVLRSGTLQEIVNERKKLVMWGTVIPNAILVIFLSGMLLVVLFIVIFWH